MHRDGIAKSGAFAEHGRNVPAVALAAKGLDVEVFEGQPGKHHNAVITLLPVKRHVPVAQTLETREGESVVGTFGFLQTQTAWPTSLPHLSPAITAHAHPTNLPSFNLQPPQAL